MRKLSEKEDERLKVLNLRDFKRDYDSYERG